MIGLMNQCFEMPKWYISKPVYTVDRFKTTYASPLLLAHCNYMGLHIALTVQYNEGQCAYLAWSSFHERLILFWYLIQGHTRLIDLLVRW